MIAARTKDAWSHVHRFRYVNILKWSKALRFERLQAISDLRIAGTAPTQYHRLNIVKWEREQE